MKLLSTLVALFCAAHFAFAQGTNPTEQSLPYSQNFSSLAASSTTYPAGWQGHGLATSNSTTFLLTQPLNGAAGDRPLIANGTAANNGGGVYNYNGKLGFLSTGSLTPALTFAINTTGVTAGGILMSYTAMVIRNPQDASNTRVNEVVLQYRVGTSGNFTTISGTTYQNQNGAANNQQSGTTGQNPQNFVVALPAACNNQATVQLRWTVRDVSGSGGRPSFAFTNISVAQDNTAPTVSTFVPANAATGVSTTSDLSITFSETIVKGTGNIVIRNASDNSVFQSIDVTTAAVTVSGATATIATNARTAGAGYYVEIPSTAFTDLAGNAFAGFSGSGTWAWTSINQSINTSTGSITFPGNVNVNANSANQTYTLGGTNISADIVLNVTGPFAISKDGSTGWGSTLTYTAAEYGTTPTVYVRFTPTAEGAATGSIVHTSTSVPNVTVNLSGTGVDPFSQNFTFASGANPGKGWTTFSRQGAQNWSTNASGRAGQGFSINGFSSGCQNNDDWLISPALDLSSANFADTPVLTFFTNTQFVGPVLRVYASTNYTGSGDPLAAGVTWTELPNFLISATSGTFTGWSGSPQLSLADFKQAGVYIAFVYASTTGTNTCANWILDDIAIANVGGTVAPFISSVPASLSGFGTTNAVPSTPQTLNVQATNLTADITITAPAEFEVSLTSSSGYGTSVTLAQANGRVLATQVFVRLNPTTTGPKSGNVTLASGSASVNVAVSGTSTTGSPGSVILSQYYEGVSNDKWIEITNVGGTAVNLASPQLYVLLFSNPGTGTDLNEVGVSNTFALTGTLNPGASLLLRNSSATSPAAGNITGTPVAANSVTTFNGDDVIALSTSNSTVVGAAWGARIDVIGDGSMWGQDKSFYRNASVNKSNVNYTPAEWTQTASLADVNTAAAGVTQRLGFHISTPSTDPFITLTPTVLNFGSQVTGTSTTVPLTYTLTGGNLTFNTEIRASGPFQISTTSLGPWVSIISPGYTPADISTPVTIYVRYNPTTVGNDTASVTHVNINMGSPPPVVLLRGIGQDPSTLAWDFNSCTAPAPTTDGLLNSGWYQYSVTGAQRWACTTFGRNTSNGVQISGFSGGPLNNEDWLISPALNLSAYANFPLLSFWSISAFSGPSLSLRISTNYTGTGDPSLATWTTLNANFPVVGSSAWTQTAGIDLSAYKQAGVYIAFVYTSSTTAGASRWTVDDVAIVNSTTAPPPQLSFTIDPLKNYNFGLQAVNTNSASNSFTFSASNFTANLIVTAPAGMQVSADNVTFAASVQYTPAQLQPVNTLYVRFSPTEANRVYGGPVVFSSAGFTATNAGFFTGTTLDKSASLDVVTWNVEWFGSDANGPADKALQLANAITVLKTIDADIYCLQEIAVPFSTNPADLSNPFNNLVAQLNAATPGVTWAGVMSPYTSNNDPLGQRVSYIYKTAIVTPAPASVSPLGNPFVLMRNNGVNPGSYLSPAYPDADPTRYWASGRWPFVFVFDATLGGGTQRYHMVGLHARANSSTDAQNRYNMRKYDVERFKDSLDARYGNANLIILGDYNDDVDFTVAAISSTVSSYDAFNQGATSYRTATRVLSDAGARSYVTQSNMIDHIMVSNELFNQYLDGSQRVYTPDNFGTIANYGTTTSDHMPVETRFVLPTTITSIAPTTGGTGTSITITGSNFTTASAVTIGGVAAASFTVSNATTIVAVVGTGATGPVQVTTAGGASSFGTFTYVAAPNAPTATAATAITQTGFTANWTAATTGTAATGFVVEISTDNFTTILQTFTITSGTTTSQAVTGLTANTAYSYRVRATNAGGTSANSNVINVTTLVNVPNAPTATAATAITQTGFTANWTAATTGTAATGFVVEVSTDNFTTILQTFTITSGTTTSQAVTGLIANTAYSYRVRATNAGGASANSNVINVNTIVNAPNAPTATAATAITQTSFTTNWTAASTGAAATGFVVEVGTTGFATILQTINVNNGSATSQAITGLSPNTQYVYRVRATNAGGASANSNTINVTTLLPPPTITSFTPTSGPRGSTVVSVTGTNFTGVVNVTVNGLSVTTFSVISTAQLVFGVPASAPIGSGPITVTTAGGTATSATNFTVSPATSLDNAFTTGAVQLYPNPVADVLRFRGRLPQAGQTIIRVYAMGGSLVTQAELNATGRDLDTQLDVSTLAAGLYVVEITNGGELMRTRIVKQ
jgi:endonuclease/exonuclease/phosphatase family metal-dependent hydrolase